MTKIILLTLCTKFKTPVAPSKRFSKLLKFYMVYFISKINEMRDEEVKHLTFDFCESPLCTALCSFGVSTVVNVVNSVLLQCFFFLFFCFFSFSYT